MLTTEEKRERAAAELAEIKQRIAECDAHAEQLRQRRLALLESGLRLEGRLAALDEVLRDALPSPAVIDDYQPPFALGEEH